MRADSARAGGWSSGLVLAAGGSSRMGSPKQLLPVDGRPLLEVVVSQACASQLDEVVVVLGGNAAAIKERVDFGRARTVVNRDYAQGMSSSLRLGLASLSRETGRTVVILGDQPGVSASLLDQLLDLQRASGCRKPLSASTGCCTRPSCWSARSGRTSSPSRATSAAAR